jgi:AraC family transcriptional regulator
MPPDISAAELSYAEDQRQCRHAHEETTISIVLSGSLVERVARTEEVARPLSVVVKPSGTEHEDRFGPRGARILQITLASGLAARLREWQSPIEQWRWMHGGPGVAPFLHVLRLVRHHGTGGHPIPDAVIEVLAALSANVSEPNRRPPRWLELVREQIDDSHTRTPRVHALAHAAHVHPVHLAREFRRHFGVSVTEYVQRRRLQRAAALLVDTRAAPSSLAYDAGYTDQSHFCRLFKRETGLTPVAFRQLIATPRTAK